MNRKRIIEELAEFDYELNELDFPNRELVIEHLVAFYNEMSDEELSRRASEALIPLEESEQK